MTSFTQAEEGHLQSLLRDDRHLSFPPASAQSSSAAETMEMKDLRGEHMFDKVVTPSDVGKLNRLVIPKHHAQKYFPLDTNAKEKGLMLPFHDSTGKEWRFRYSYWSSSQSYVLTKGWSRFVREMKLHAGDVVSFHRAADARNVVRLYISWRRRASKAALFFSHGRGGRTGKAQHLNNGEASMAAVAPLRVEQANGQASHLMTVDMFGDGQINCNTPAVYDGRGQSWSRELLPQFMELKPAERLPGDRSYAAEKPAATGSNKRVRLFGVTLNE